MRMSSPGSEPDELPLLYPESFSVPHHCIRVVFLYLTVDPSVTKFTYLYPPPTTHHLLPTTYYPPPTTHHLLPTTYYPPPTTYSNYLTILSYYDYATNRPKEKPITTSP